MDAIHKLLRRLLSREQRRFLKFCVVGASGVPINLLCTWVGYHLLFAAQSDDWRKASSFLLGIAVSILTNFLLNDIWTWRDRQKTRGSGGLIGRLARFYLVSSVGALLQFGTAMALSLWLGFHYLVAQLFGIALATAVNFVVNNVWTFRDKKKPDSPPPPAREPAVTAEEKSR